MIWWSSTSFWQPKTPVQLRSPSTAFPDRSGGLVGGGGGDAMWPLRRCPLADACQVLIRDSCLAVCTEAIRPGTGGPRDCEAGSPRSEPVDV